MGKRALDFSSAHPDPDPGYATAVAHLADRLGRATELIAGQNAGIVQVRNATARKFELRRTLTRQHFNHLASVARRAAVEAPDLERQLALLRLNAQGTLLGFRTTARQMVQEATAQKELLAKYGLSGAMFDQLVTLLDQFDATVDQGVAGRQQHVGATKELDRVADEVVQGVAVLNGLNRARFAHDPNALCAWESASSVVTVHPHVELLPPSGTPTSDAAKPAA